MELNSININSKIESQLKEISSEIGELAVSENVPFDHIKNRLYQEISQIQSLLSQNLTLSMKFGQVRKICFKIIYLCLTVVGLIDKIVEMTSYREHCTGYPINWGSNSPLDKELSEQAQYHIERLKKTVNVYDSIKMFISAVGKTEYPINSTVEKNIRNFIFDQYLAYGIIDEKNTLMHLNAVIEYKNKQIH